MSLPLFPHSFDGQPTIASGERGQTRNQYASEDMVIEQPDPFGTKPVIGLLSQTLVSSPIIQWVLPARLRSKYQNDVVFVGERHIQIKEALSGVHLEDVNSKSDFDAYIMAAKVINVSTELPWEAQMKLAAHNATAPTNLDPRQELPPQILVLSLASRELVFIYYSTTSGQFIHHHRPLPNDVSTFERFGRNIAVEPRSRAVAVSASADYFGIFMLRKPPGLQSQMVSGRLDPIAEERFFRVDGDIMFMEFLYPKSEDGNKIILLLLVSHEQMTHAICYEWHADETIRQASPRMTRRVLPLEDRLPTMLIPLTKTSSFMLITTTSMAVYKNRLDPRRQPSRYPLPAPDRESQKAPLWTRWARPLRNWLYNQRHDDIYLCREDGRVFYLGIGNEGELENQAHLGRLCCDVDAAFDILDIGHEGGDLLLTAGTTGDGGLFVQKARDHPRCVQKFINWTPVTDSVVVSGSRDPSASEAASDRVFVCSASPFARGAIVELRHGLEAQIGLVVSLEELTSTRDIWTMSNEVGGGVFILFSDPVSSILLYLPSDFGEEMCAIDEADSGLEFSAQTLAAGCTSSGVIVQVTEKAILLETVSGSTLKTRFDYDDEQSVAVAAINRSASLIVTAVRTRHEVHLYAKRAGISDDEVQLFDLEDPSKLPYEPVCMSIETLGSSTFIFIGTGNGKVLIYSIKERITLESETSVAVQEGDDLSKAIESLAVIFTQSKEHSQRYTVLCGLRSGVLVPFEMAVDVCDLGSPIGLKQGSPRRIGSTSVKIQGRGHFALLTCGHGFWQASCPEEDGLLDPNLHLQRIWITDKNNPAYHPSNIDSFAMAKITDPNVDGVSDTLFCIADGQLLICTLDHAAKTVPRRIDLPGSANRLAYSSHLKSLIVAYTQTELDTDSDPIRRLTRPFIEFVEPDTQRGIERSTEVPEEDENPAWRPSGAAGEKISCILEWTPRKGDEEYHFIVIGTARKQQQDRGRVIFLQAARNPSNPSRIECSVKYVHKFEGPVYSIAPYGDFTLMVSTGHEIVPLEPKFSQTRRARAARYSTLSPAVSMSCHEPYVYMSTSRESLMVLKFSEDKMVLHAYDRQKHDGLSHFHLGGEFNLTITSSRGGRVSVLTERGITENDKMMPVALCEAHLASSVMKLSTGSKPSPLSSPFPVLYGIAMNGTAYRFLTLNEKEWRLLRLLQSLCIRDILLCPFTPKRKRRRNPIGSGAAEPQPSHMHIDGDILSRLAIRGSDYLTQMLMTQAFEDTASPENGTAQATMERFAELSNELLGECPNQIEEVMRWLKRTLHVEF
ncbi:protein thtA [Aspergillus clavatus NRRL 1]|uniref:Uncharacterized protein n=1 Tax=Aspergillus clavatus (strain ATCC 1007 / CBS 513.65 / DSM 816 / NCTC 3887 / NRRL 1 / QM 1276 / 107) TaxID=344612 RepID=A1CRQ7_ASPCL|nr:uncharacterized protein ACLA_030610 [Aspergillus clavatus NRRL 1]EAW08328.1 conserved hypothetical protein [Aspergillus clavatus NRRL 1]